MVNNKIYKVLITHVDCKTTFSTSGMTLNRANSNFNQILCWCASGDLHLSRAALVNVQGLVLREYTNYQTKSAKWHKY